MLRSIEVARAAAALRQALQAEDRSRDRLKTAACSRPSRRPAAAATPGSPGRKGRSGWRSIATARSPDRSGDRGDPAYHRDQPLRHRGHLDRRRALARHLGRRRERSDPHRSAYGRSPGAARDAVRRERVGAGVPTAAISSSAAAETAGRCGPSAGRSEAERRAAERRLGRVLHETQQPLGVLGLASARPNLPATSAMRLHPVRVSIRPSARTIRIFLKSVGMDSWE